ncbi:DUF4397 domain-containing protein [Parapedobacter soli]|uniref:DUF4397 domain-containing protein n=1 Tax=Parapedobacter soli TaxID=416955 RepID=UPI0021C70DF2|nr:DUF4397 domain-containing protein [Parapedobacter soli]
MKQSVNVKMKKKTWFLATALVVISVVLGGCFKDDDQLYRVSAVRALNGVPGSGQLDIFLDYNKLNFNDIVREDEGFAYSDTLPYKNAWPNSRVVSIVDPVDYPNAEPIVQKTVNFVPGSFYSLYVVGYENIEVISTEDDLTEPAEGKAKIRFIHLSPDAPALDFEIHSDAVDPLIISDKAFKEASDFVSIDGGITCTVDFIEHSSGDVLHTFEFEPAAGMIYTLWVKGLLSDTENISLGFGHGILIH